MSLREGLARIVAGRRSDALLQSVRLEAGGGVAFGEEAVLAHFQRHPAALDDADWVEAPHAFAMFAGEEAVVGDLYDGRIGRLWRIGAAGEPAEPGVSVAFDPDLAQARRDVFARAEDHPDLDAEGFAALLEAGRGLVAETVPGEASPFRARAWLVRGVAGPGAVAGLFALHLLGNEPERRSAGFTYAAVLIDAAGVRSVRDAAGEAHRRSAAWRPRLVR